MILAEFEGLALDAKTGDDVMLIKRTDNGTIVPIWIGSFEAFSIAIALAGVKPPRPLTHDLMLDIIEAMGGKVSRVVITGLKENTFYALIHIDRGDVETYVIDARPSDSIALAVRAGCAIYVSPELPTFDLENPESERDKQVAERLKKIDPEQLLDF